MRVSGEDARTADGMEHRPLGWHPDYAANFASVTRLLPGLDSPNALGTYHTDIEEAAAAAVQAAGGDPKSLHEAQSRSNWLCWKEAMDCELSTLQQAGTWETVPRPKDKNAVRLVLGVVNPFTVDDTLVFQTQYCLPCSGLLQCPSLPSSGASRSKSLQGCTLCNDLGSPPAAWTAAAAASSVSV